MNKNVLFRPNITLHLNKDEECVPDSCGGGEEEEEIIPLDSLLSKSPNYLKVDDSIAPDSLSLGGQDSFSMAESPSDSETPSSASEDSSKKLISITESPNINITSLSIPEKVSPSSHSPHEIESTKKPIKSEFIPSDSKIFSGLVLYFIKETYKTESAFTVQVLNARARGATVLNYNIGRSGLSQQNIRSKRSRSEEAIHLPEILTLDELQTIPKKPPSLDELHFQDSPKNKSAKRFKSNTRYMDSPAFLALTSSSTVNSSSISPKTFPSSDIIDISDSPQSLGLSFIDSDSLGSIQSLPKFPSIDSIPSSDTITISGSSSSSDSLGSIHSLSKSPSLDSIPSLESFPSLHSQSPSLKTMKSSPGDSFYDSSKTPSWLYTVALRTQSQLNSAPKFTSSAFPQLPIPIHNSGTNLSWMKGKGTTPIGKKGLGKPNLSEAQNTENNPIVPVSAFIVWENCIQKNNLNHLESLIPPNIGPHITNQEETFENFLSSSWISDCISKSKLLPMIPYKLTRLDAIKVKKPKIVRKFSNNNDDSIFISNPSLGEGGANVTTDVNIPYATKSSPLPLSEGFSPFLQDSMNEDIYNAYRSDEVWKSMLALDEMMDAAIHGKTETQSTNPTITTAKEQHAIPAHRFDAIQPELGDGDQVSSSETSPQIEAKSTNWANAPENIHPQELKKLHWQGVNQKRQELNQNPTFQNKQQYFGTKMVPSLACQSQIDPNGIKVDGNPFQRMGLNPKSNQAKSVDRDCLLREFVVEKLNQEALIRQATSKPYNARAYTYAASMIKKNAKKRALRAHVVFLSEQKPKGIGPKIVSYINGLIHHVESTGNLQVPENETSDEVKTIILFCKVYGCAVKTAGSWLKQKLKTIDDLIKKDSKSLGISPEQWKEWTVRQIEHFGITGERPGESSSSSASASASASYPLSSSSSSSNPFESGNTITDKEIERELEDYISLKKSKFPKPPFLSHQQRIGVKYFDDLNKKNPKKIVYEISQQIKKYLFSISQEARMETCGSYRRGKEKCGDIDILITKPKVSSVITKPKEERSSATENPFEELKLMLRLVILLRKNGLIVDHLMFSEHKYMGIVKLPHSQYIHLDLLIVHWHQFPTSLLYFTGSAYFNRSMRFYAKKIGHRLSEKSLKKVKRNAEGNVVQEERIDVRTEKDVFIKLNLRYVPPHLRNV